MEAKSIRNRNDVIDSLMYGLKMAGYIDNETVRKNVEDCITACLTNILSFFNDGGETE